MKNFYNYFFYKDVCKCIFHNLNILLKLNDVLDHISKNISLKEKKKSNYRQYYRELINIVTCMMYFFAKHVWYISAHQIKDSHMYYAFIIHI